MSAPPLTPRAALRWASLAPVLRRLRPASILEIGCGMGAAGARLAGHGAYLGIEPDQLSYERAAWHIRPLGGRVLNCADQELLRKAAR